MGEGIITYTPEMKTSFMHRYDADGTVHVEVITHDDVTPDTVYRVIADPYGNKLGDLVAGIYYFFVGVACTSCPAGAKGWIQIGGIHRDVNLGSSMSLTKGHALVLSGGAVVDSGVVYSGAAGQFAIAMEDTDSSETADLMLIPERIVTIS